MQQRPTDAPPVRARTEPYPPWDPVFPYNNLPPVPREQLTTPAIEARCRRATTALDTLRDAARRLSDPLALLHTTTLIEAQASSAIEGIVTTVGQMLELMDRPRLSNATDPDADDALRHHKSIIDAWQRRGAEPVGTAMAIRACSTTKGRRMPVRRGRGTVIAGPHGIVYTPPTREKRIRSMLDELWRFMREDAGTHPLVRMAAGHHQFESIHPFADGNGRTGRLINMLYLSEQQLTDLPVLCHSRYILRNRPTYYPLLDSTRKTGDWKRWTLWMLDGVRETAEWIARTLERQAAIAERAVARYRGAKPRPVTGDDTVRFVSGRLCCRSTDLVDARVTAKPATALAVLRPIAGAGILREWPGHKPALFVNPEALALWTGE